MLFRFEEYSYRFALMLLLLLSAVLSIVISQADLSGKKKYRLLKRIRQLNTLIIFPAGIFLLVAPVAGIVKQEFITVENSMWRAILALGAAFILVVATYSILPLSNEGIRNYRRNLITSTSYSRVFQKIRNSLVAMMVAIALCYAIYQFFRT
jgi:hypothetical protein